MYINDLGIGRTTSVNNRNYVTRTANAINGKNTDSYATVMKKAVDNQTVAGYPSFTTAGDIIIQEAIKKMETDPEWEESVMNKVKEYYSGDYDVDSAQKSYLNLMGQNVLQNYLVQGLIGGQSSLGLGTAYSPYGFGNLATSAYSSLMNNSAFSSSLFGSWQL